MTDTTGIKVEGLPELVQFLEKTLPENLQRTSLVAGMKASMKPMVEYAKATAPERSGALKASIKARTLPKRDVNFAAITWGPMTNVPASQNRWVMEYLYGKGWSMSDKGVLAGPYYGKFHEFGYYNKLLDKHIPGKHFLRRSFDLWLPSYLAHLKRHVRKKAIESAKRHNAKSKAKNKRNSR